MNKILQLYDQNYVVEYFKRKVLPKFPEFIGIKRVEIIPHKNQVWRTNYHVVLEFKVCFQRLDGGEYWSTLYASAHSSEPRKNVYVALKALMELGFNNDRFVVPKPVTYSGYFNAAFYQGIDGKNLDYYIFKQDFGEVEKMIPQAAELFAYVHGQPNDNHLDFNPINSRIITVIPGMEHILKEIGDKYPDLYGDYSRIYKELDRREKAFFGDNNERWLIHGDAHPENVIRVEDNRLGLVDFTDMSLGDFARDLGSFTQQLDYMITRKMESDVFAEKMKNLFLDSYFAVRGVEPSLGVLERISTYYNWTAMRTATLHLLREPAEKERSVPLIDMVKKHLSL